MFFFLGMASLCVWFGVRLKERWLLVNAVLFVGLAFTPYLTGAWLWGWWAWVGITAWVMGRRRTASEMPALPPPPVHYAVCRPYRSSATSEDRA